MKRIQKTPVNILIIDDDPVIRRVLSHQFAAAGYHPETAENGEKALELLNTSPSVFSLIILDRKMEKLSGIGVLHELNKHPKLQKIPVILLTSFAETPDKIAATLAGVFDIIIKPDDGDWEPLLLAAKRALQKGTPPLRAKRVFPA